ncbi:hypothetical protein EYF80_038001 [Liparis tanakae]|uniref:Uncharacterized protein n=1 Tax=Liparis tanakae TaxID=230148 RepID=A0A4Z2GFV1_9TELE|nr:hypothetical protein EYF80_038001 [Liparis tanakae]
MAFDEFNVNSAFPLSSRFNDGSTLPGSPPRCPENVSSVRSLALPRSPLTPAGNVSYCWSNLQLVPTGSEAALLPVASLWTLH